MVAQARIFEEGIISTGDYETHPAFSPSGDTLYFLKGLPDAGFFSICVSYKKNGKWSAPQVAPFSGRYTDADPFYISHRVNGTWSKAKKLPEPINSSVTEWGGKE